MEILQCKFLATESQIAVVVEPENERLPAGDKEPLADVKLGAVHQEGTLCSRQDNMVVGQEGTLCSRQDNIASSALTVYYKYVSKCNVIAQIIGICIIINCVIYCYY